MSAGKEKRAMLKVKRNLVVLLAAVLALSAFAGCGRKEDTAVPAAAEQELQHNAEGGADGNAAEQREENNALTAPAVIKNTTSVFTGDTLIEIPMGSEDGENSAKLCTVKMGADYLVAGQMINTQGETELIGQAFATHLSDLSFDNTFITEAVVGAQGEINDKYTFMVSPSSKFSVDLVKESISNGVDINTDGKHAAYATYESRFDALFVYTLNDDWTFVIEYSGDLPNRISVREFGETFYGLVTPVL